jgi:non-specific serine/threonine protein kinase
MAIATALGVREVQGVPVMDRLLALLSQRSMLLVLDNCERLIEAPARMAEQLLTGCADLCMLATGREALNLATECHYHVRPLAAPDIEVLAGPGDPAQGPAVALFLPRVRAVEADFGPTGDNSTPSPRSARGWPVSR